MVNHEEFKQLMIALLETKQEKLTKRLVSFLWGDGDRQCCELPASLCGYNQSVGTGYAYRRVFNIFTL